MKPVFSIILFIILQFSARTNGQIIDQNFCIDHGFGSGLFPHPDPQKCSSFVHCAMFIPIPQVCPTGKIFAPDLYSSSPYGSCEYGNAETCELFTTTTTSKPSTITDTTTNMDDLTLSAESTTISEFTTDLTTNSPTTIEIILTTTSRFPTTTPIPVHRCPPGGTGYIPHHTNCSRYFECIKGIRHLRFCPYGLLFDSVTLQCTYPELAVCAGI